jgi:hypothetical protein
LTLFCRLAAREISALKPILDSNEVKLVAVGFDAAGMQSFLSGNYFNGGQSH